MIFDRIKTINILGRTIEIKRIKDLAPDTGILGSWQSDFNRINIQDISYCDSQSFDITILHELQHAMFDLAGEKGMSGNESLVDRLCELNYQIIKQILEAHSGCNKKGCCKNTKRVDGGTGKMSNKKRSKRRTEKVH